MSAFIGNRDAIEHELDRIFGGRFLSRDENRAIAQRAAQDIGADRIDHNLVIGIVDRDVTRSATRGTIG